MELSDLVLFLWELFGYGNPGNLLEPRIVKESEFHSTLIFRHKINSMKQLFLFIVLAIFFFPDLQAQSSLTNRMNLIWEIGPQFTSIENPGYHNTPTERIKPNIGLTAEYILKDRLSVSLGLFYDARGYRARYQSSYIIENDTSTYVGYQSYIKYDLSYSANYVSFPFYFTYMSGGRHFSLFVRAGIYVSVFLNSKQKTYYDYYISPQDIAYFSDSTLTVGHHPQQSEGPVKNFFNTYDFGFNISVGIVYRWNSRFSFKFTPGFNYGLAHAFEDPENMAKWDRITKLNMGIVYKLRPVLSIKN